ncbi:glycoside hydrolase family 6 protein [Embleya hyalina]|nr:glycoside hydrolase family 6 protein [Embleya hyalina]
MTCVVGLAGVGQATPAAGKEDLVTNGAFEPEPDYWWTTGATTAETVEGRARITVPDRTSAPWDSMLGQGGLHLTNLAVYTLSFDASATVTAKVRITVQSHLPPYRTVLDRTVTFAENTAGHTLRFLAMPGIDATQVTFQFGGRAKGFQATVDNVSLRPTGSPIPGVPAKPSASSRPGAKPADTPVARPSSASPPAGATTSSPAIKVPPASPGEKFYTDPMNNAAAWVREHGSDPRAAKIRTAIASQAGGRWFGAWSGDIGTAVRTYVDAAAATRSTPILVPYNIPDRDCGGASAGGAAGSDAYRRWISDFAGAVGDRSAIVVIEPDAVANVDCMSTQGRDARFALLRYATEQFKAKAPNAKVYLDGGNAGWIEPTAMASRLARAGVANVRGFAVNVSNHKTTADSAGYAEKVRAALPNGGARTANYLIDTSRNGNGRANGVWCNPAGSKLGKPSRAGTGGAEYELWIKVPGDSDGPCGIAPGVAAGTFDPNLATRLIDGS